MICENQEHFLSLHAALFEHTCHAAQAFSPSRASDQGRPASPRSVLHTSLAHQAPLVSGSVQARLQALPVMGASAGGERALDPLTGGPQSPGSGCEGRQRRALGPERTPEALHPGNSRARPSIPLRFHAGPRSGEGPQRAARGP